MYFSKMISKLRTVNMFRCLSGTSKKVEIANARKNSFNTAGHNSIVISKSWDIFENLALEDWLYTNCDLSPPNSSILLMWANEPAVVIGRHQNPWIECSEKFCTDNRIKLARRNSGGGAVYHDCGNLNLSFLTSRNNYDRKRNLELICEAINKEFNINLSVSKRHDILYNDRYKVSGTASKLGRTNAYHHCTVLVEVKEYKLHNVLHTEREGVESKATSSTRSEIINLIRLRSNIDVEMVIEAIKNYYKQLHKVQDEHIFCISPSESDFPGINQIKEGLKSWEWLYGHTPRFTITKSFPIEGKNPTSSIEIVINVNKGIIESITVEPQVLEENSYEALKRNVFGKRFSYVIHHSLNTWIYACNDRKMGYFVKDCIQEMVFGMLR